MSRQDQSLLTVNIVFADGSRLALGTFDKRNGGAITSESTKYRPGGQSSQVSLGGPTTTENITVQALNRLERFRPHIARLRAGVGSAKAEVIEQPLDINYVAYGSPDVYRGTLVGLTPPDYDSESSDASLLELEVEVEGLPS